MEDRVTLQEITEDDLDAVLALDVAEDQRHLVASNARSIAQAHYSKNAWFRAIYAGDEPVGFVMLSLDANKPEYFLWRLMIDHRYQGKGYGKAAMAQVIEFVNTLPGAKELLTSYVPDQKSAAQFYSSLGFRDTGLIEGGEKVVSLTLEQ